MCLSQESGCKLGLPWAFWIPKEAEDDVLGPLCDRRPEPSEASQGSQHLERPQSLLTLPEGAKGFWTSGPQERSWSPTLGWLQTYWLT